MHKRGIVIFLTLPLLISVICETSPSHSIQSSSRFTFWTQTLLVHVLVHPFSSYSKNLISEESFILLEVDPPFYFAMNTIGNRLSLY